MGSVQTFPDQNQDIYPALEGLDRWDGIGQNDADCPENPIQAYYGLGYEQDLSSTQDLGFERELFWEERDLRYKQDSRYEQELGYDEVSEFQQKIV